MLHQLTQDEFLVKENLPVNILLRDPQIPFPLHQHDFSELVIVHSGTGTHFTTDDEYLLQAGDVFVIQGNMIHGYKDIDDLKLVNIIYDPARTGLNDEDLKDLAGYHVIFTLEPVYRAEHSFRTRLQLNSRQLDRAWSLCEELGRELAQKKGGYRFAMKSRFRELVLYLSRCREPGETAEDEHISRIAETISFMERNHDRSVSVSELLDICYLSESSLLRAFKKSTGFSPIEYHSRIRILRACELLRHNTDNVTEIAFSLGFEDSNYFSRLFRKIMGQSPSAYRKARLLG